MILDDLRRFRASPEVPRLAVALCVTAAVMLFALASTGLPNPDATVHSSAVEQPLYKGLVDGSNPSAPTLTIGKCQHLVRGQWLYWSIEHNGDRVEYHHCEYTGNWRGRL